MASQPAYRRVDGIFGVGDDQLLYATVWADAATYTKGQLLVINLSGTPGTGYKYCFKKGAADDTDPGGVVIAETITTPTGGGPVKVIAGGRIDGATWGLAAKGAISLGDRVSSSSTSGSIKASAGLGAAARHAYGTCVDAFDDGSTNGAVLWDPCPWL